ncbi:hypothetical protein ACFOZ7_00140 [Natribaculum luteum]|uniref:Uncharacterized protein n=1 Tax=Natribaculum luteum TaxID=1586232 RepID=A0ABD5NTI6_9EURY|nr:hypothetical protein [Natribaculum luteum]
MLDAAIVVRQDEVSGEVMDAAIVVRQDEVSGEVMDDHLEVSDRPSGLAAASVDESSPRIRSAFAHDCGRG